MKDIRLKSISISDIEWLDKTEYKSLPVERREKLVEDSEKCSCMGEFFRFFLIKADGKVVGVINVQGHGKDVVSVAPEIFTEYRGKGLAYESLILAYAFVKENGFKQLIAGIREENIASQKLHLKLGFKYISDSISKNGNKLKTYQKLL